LQISGRFGAKRRLGGSGHSELPDGGKVHLALYTAKRCSYCWVVHRAVEQLAVDCEYRDIVADSTHLSDLVRLTGRRTVPCMLVDGQPMFESVKIVEWLYENYEGSQIT
jgi:glutaredoxin